MTYDYNCPKCNITEEKVHGMNETPTIKCKCGHKMNKLFTAHLGNHNVNGGGSSTTPR